MQHDVSEHGVAAGWEQRRKVGAEGLAEGLAGVAPDAAGDCGGDEGLEDLEDARCCWFCLLCYCWLR